MSCPDLPPTEGLRDWRLDLKDHDIELFEALAGDLLTRIGYLRYTQRPSRQIAKLAEECRDAWEAEMDARERRHEKRRLRTIQAFNNAS